MLNAAQLQILRLLTASGPTARAELGARTGLSKAAISGLTRSLLDGGHLLESKGAPGQGRAARLLDLNPCGALFLGLSILDDPAVLALVDFRGRLLDRVEMPRPTRPEALTKAVQAALPKLTIPEGAMLAGMGVTLPGLIDPGQAICIRSNRLRWRDVPLAGILAKATGLPVCIENDAKSLAVSEKMFGAARDRDDFTLIWLGSALGAAHFIHGKLHRGAHGGAGEISHVTVELDGLPCPCGKLGCLYTVASLTSILELARAEGLKACTLTELEHAAERGNLAAIRILHRAGSAMGLAIAQVIQINDPDMVLISHSEAAFDGLFARVMHQVIWGNVHPTISGATPIRIRRIDGDDWAVAAAGVAAHRFLNGQLQEQL